MEFLDVLRKKRQGKSLSAGEINDLVSEYVSGEIPDYQMSAFLMAVFFRGMSEEETSALTNAMANSGSRLDLSEVQGFKVDKHSTGGVGDSVSLILVPLAAASGLVIGKLSGRALGHTGGTIDKLESIPGFQVSLSLEEFTKNLQSSGLCIMQHTSELVPADEKLYELRNATATVESLPLIIGSIMSKKIACGPDGIVLDVKVGSGGFVKDLETGKRLAKGCLKIGRREGIKVTAVLTDMDRPLSPVVGNSLEIRHAVQVLKGEVGGRLKELVLNLNAEFLLQSGRCESFEQAARLSKKVLESGDALSKFREMVRNQGGDPQVVEDYELLPSAEFQVTIDSPSSGYLAAIDAFKVGQSTRILGAGRKKKGDPIDLGAGVELLQDVGDRVSPGVPLARVHYNDQESFQGAEPLLEDSFTISDKPPSEPDLVKARFSYP